MMETADHNLKIILYNLERNLFNGDTSLKATDKSFAFNTSEPGLLEDDHEPATISEDGISVMDGMIHDLRDTLQDIHVIDFALISDCDIICDSHISLVSKATFTHSTRDTFMTH